MWIQEEAASIDEPTSNVIDSEDVRSPTHKRHKDSTSFSLHADTYEDVRDELLISSAAEIVMVAYSSVFSGNGDPLEFWKVNERLYPLLANMARRYLSSPATSVASEQLFSLARDVYNYKPSNLGGDSAEKLIFLNKCFPVMHFQH